MYEKFSDTTEQNCSYILKLIRLLFIYTIFNV
jgi:hypothetical protein